MFRRALIVAAITLAAAGCGGTSEASIATKAANAHYGVKNASCDSWGQVNLAGAPADTFQCSVGVPINFGAGTRWETVYIAVRSGTAYSVSAP